MDQKTLVIQTKLEHDNDFLFQCVLLLYDKQEEDEQSDNSTRHQNGVGFNKADGTLLSLFAKQIKAEDWENAATYMENARQRMLKYARQLSNLLTDI